MSLDGGRSQGAVVAALEDWLDSSGEMDDLIDGEMSQETDETEGNPTEDEEETDSSDDEVEDTDDSADDDTDEELEGDEDAEDDGISSLEAIAEYFEVEPDEVLENLQVEAGDGSQVSIREALQRWHEAEDGFESRVISMQEEFTKARNQVEQQATEAAQRLGQLTVAMVQRMKRDYSDDRMRQIREEDPDRYIQMIEERQALEADIEKAINAVGEVADRQQAQSQEEIRSLLQREHAALLKAKPAYRDKKVYSKAMREGVEYLKSIGFEDQDINSIMDHRMLLVISDAVEASKLRKSTDSKRIEALQRKGLKKPAPGLRRQSRSGVENPNRKAKAAARAKLRKSGDVRDAAALMEDFI